MRRTLSDNPALKWFGGSLGEEGLYEAEEAVVLWDAPEGAVQEVAVVFFPFSRIPAQHAVWREWRSYCLQWDFAFGSMSPGWLKTETATPEHLFWHFVSCGFATMSEQNRALVEFGRIAQCEWARSLTTRLNISRPVAARRMRLAG